MRPGKFCGAHCVCVDDTTPAFPDMPSGVNKRLGAHAKELGCICMEFMTRSVHGVQVTIDPKFKQLLHVQGSSVVTKIGVVLQSPTIIPDVIGSALTSSSNFFINYVAIQVSFPTVIADKGEWEKKGSSNFVHYLRVALCVCELKMFRCSWKCMQMDSAGSQL